VTNLRHHAHDAIFFHLCIGIQNWDTSVSRIARVIYSIRHIYYRWTRAYSWNGTHLWTADCNGGGRNTWSERQIIVWTFLLCLLKPDWLVSLCRATVRSSKLLEILHVCARCNYRIRRHGSVSGVKYIYRYIRLRPVSHGTVTTAERANQSQRKNEKNGLTFFWLLCCDWFARSVFRCWFSCHGTTFWGFDQQVNFNFNMFPFWLAEFWFVSQICNFQSTMRSVTWGLDISGI